MTVRGESEEQHFSDRDLSRAEAKAAAEFKERQTQNETQKANKRVEKIERRERAGRALPYTAANEATDALSDKT